MGTPKRSDRCVQFHSVMFPPLVTNTTKRRFKQTNQHHETQTNKCLTCTNSLAAPSAYSETGRETGNFMRQLNDPFWPVCSRRCVSVDW